MCARNALHRSIAHSTRALGRNGAFAQGAGGQGVIFLAARAEACDADDDRKQLSQQMRDACVEYVERYKAETLPAVSWGLRVGARWGRAFL